MCEIFCQSVQKKQEEKRIEEEQAVKAQSWKFPVCYIDDDDEESSNPLEDNIISELPSYYVVTPTELVDSLSMGDEHLNTISATKSNEVIKSCVENLVPNPSESEGENGCDVPAGFTTFSNVLFDDDYDSDSSDDQSLSVEDSLFLRRLILFSMSSPVNSLFSNHFCRELMKLIVILRKKFILPRDCCTTTHLLVQQKKLSLTFLMLILNLSLHLLSDSSIISSSSKIDSLLDEFADELTLLKSIPSGVHKTDRHPKNEIRLSQRLLYENSSPRPPEEFNSENSNAEIESFSPSPIPIRIVTLLWKKLIYSLIRVTQCRQALRTMKTSKGTFFF
nr:hypothetical protein [Tanacetum cinerariifolium]